MYIRSLEWYEEKYGEDWAEIVREEDIRQAKIFGKVMVTEEDFRRQFDKSTSWAFNEVSGQ